MNDNNIILVIGESGYGQLGLKTTNDVVELVRFHNYNQDKYITSIHSGRFFTIFGDWRSQTYFSVGYNLSGQCGIGNHKYIIPKLQIIEYFMKNNIKIKSIKTSPNGYNTFWITDKNIVYSQGPNRRNQLGLHTIDNKYINTDINSPTKITALSSKCIDIRSAYGYNLALCSNTKCMDYHVLLFYCTKYNQLCTAMSNIPKEILNLVIIYYDINQVYSVGKCIFGANGHDKNLKQWSKINFFETKQLQIQKIRTGLNHSLFLDFEGVLFCCGRNDFGQLGLGFEKKLKDTQKDRNDVQEITFFSEQKIKIIEMECGWYHNLVIDENYEVWSWGENSFGQCGDDNYLHKNVLCPQRIAYFVENNITIKKIQCGSNHSVVQTFDGKYFMFGDNQFNQCCTDDERRKVTQPFCINYKVGQVTNGAKITQISLGCGNTKIICDRV